MDKNIIYTVIVIASMAVSASSQCVWTKGANCIFTMVCNKTVGTLPSLSCESEPVIHLVVKNSVQATIAYTYFGISAVEKRVKEIKGVDNTWTNLASSFLNYYTETLRVDISNNNIVTVQANAFYQLVKLKYLNISNNKIQSFLPASFAVPGSKVEEIDASNNLLQRIDTEMSQVPNLKKLNLSNNRLVTISEHAFDVAKLVSHLYLQHNLITGINLTFSHLNELTTLDVSNNQLSSIDKVTFKNNKNLKSLDISSNKIKTIYDNAFEYCDLEYLNLKNNTIIGDINEKIFANFQNISELDLSQQNFSGIINNAFADMALLQNLNFSHNNIRFVENYAFVNTPITVLDLSNNKIPNMDFLKNSLANLTELYLNSNFITVIPKYIFDNKEELEILDLSMNHIIEIEQHSWSLKNLKFLNLSSNFITVVPFSSLKYLYKTETLDLSRNKLSRLEDRDFYKCRELKTLLVDHNRIKTFDIERFLYILTKLKTLSLVGNPMSCKGIVHKLYIENVTFKFIREDEYTIIVKVYVEDNIYDLRCGDTPSAVKLEISTVDETHLIQNELRAMRIEMSHVKSILAKIQIAMKSQKINIDGEISEDSFRPCPTEMNYVDRSEQSNFEPCTDCQQNTTSVVGEVSAT